MKIPTRHWLRLAIAVCASTALPLQANDLPHEKGQWSELVDWPIVAIHATVTP